MTRRACLLLPFLSAARSDAATAQSVELMPSSTARVELSVEKTGLMAGRKHVFSFPRYSGRLLLNRETPQTSTVEFRLEAASIVCEDRWLSAKDLRKVQEYATHDMLAAAQFPSIQFRSAAVTRQDATHFVVHGPVTLRNVTKPVDVQVTLIAAADGAVSIEGTARFRMSQFGLKPPAAALGAIGTKDEMLLRFVLPVTAF